MSHSVLSFDQTLVPPFPHSNFIPRKFSQLQVGESGQLTAHTEAASSLIHRDYGNRAFLTTLRKRNICWCAAAAKPAISFKSSRGDFHQVLPYDWIGIAFPIISLTMSDALLISRNTPSVSAMPPEILQENFSHCLELNLCLVSKRIYQVLPSRTRLALFLPLLAFGADEVVDKIVHNRGNDCSDVVTKLSVTTPLTRKDRVRL
jgi:hypothetical protein